MSERKTNTLQLVNDLTPNLTICKHCERIQGQDLQGNEESRGFTQINADQRSSA